MSILFAISISGVKFFRGYEKRLIIPLFMIIMLDMLIIMNYIIGKEREFLIN